MGAPTALQRARAKPYGETLRCPAGALCLDFCNSGQGMRDHPGAEWLGDFGDLLDWLEAQGALGAEQAKRLRRAAHAAPEAAARQWARAIELRESLHRLLEACALARTPAREDLARLEREHALSAAFTRLRWNDGRAAWTVDSSASELGAVLQPVVQSAADLLTSARLARVRRCGNPTCSWLFIDETRNRSRRWCEMASCGNVLKVRRHRERARKGASGALRARGEERKP